MWEILDYLIPLLVVCVAVWYLYHKYSKGGACDCGDGKSCCSTPQKEPEDFSSTDEEKR